MDLDDDDQPLSARMPGWGLLGPRAQGGKAPVAASPRKRTASNAPQEPAVPVKVAKRDKAVAPAVAPAANDDDDDDEPLAKRIAPAPPAKRAVPPPKKAAVPDDDDDDVPLAKRLPPPVGKAVAKSADKGTTEKKSDKGGDTKPKQAPAAAKGASVKPAPIAAPAAKPAKAAPALAKAAPPPAPSGLTKVKVEAKARAPSPDNDEDDDFDDDDDDKPLSAQVAKGLSKGKGASAAAANDVKPKKKRGSKTAETKIKAEDADAEDGEEEEEQYKWWENMDEDGEIKWHTLEHSGVLFPPAYVPHGIPFVYDGKVVALAPEAEEVATFYAALVDTDWGRNPVFQKNFFRDFQTVLKEAEKAGHPRLDVKDFGKCDFSHIARYLATLKERKAARTKEEKLAEKAEKKKIEDKYGWALLDGRKEKVGNFRVEPPGLFRGRGAHPKAGTLKRRVTPEQVTINIGEGVKVPPPPPGHKWASVVHDNTVTWLATWTENVNGATKYVWLAANSTLKGKSDLKKYDKARELKKYIDDIRRVYTAELGDSKTVTRQRATAMYLIDKLALRAGNEKDTDEEADTVGCCSLRVEHIQLREPNTVIFDFLGKDSMRYYNEVTVDVSVFKNLRLFRRGNKDDNKKPGDMLFDRITTSLVNKHLNSLMPGLTAKVFRTYNASITFQAELEKTPEGATVGELVLAYNRANRQAAILCNHQRTVPKSFDASMVKMSERINLLKLQRRQLRLQALEDDRKAARHYPAEMEPESDFDDDAAAEAEQVQARMDAEKEEKLRLKAEQAGETYTPSSPTKRQPTTQPMDSLIKKIHQIDERIAKTKLEMTDKDENKTTALGTSKINYLDPRITVAWCKRYNVPWEKVFNKSLQEKFKWAWEVADDKFVF